MKLTELRKISREAIQDPKKLAFQTVPDASYAKHRAIEAIHADDLQLAIMMLAMSIKLND